MSEFLEKCSVCGKEFIFRSETEEDIVAMIRPLLKCPSCDYREEQVKQAELERQAAEERKGRYVQLLEESNLSRYLLEYEPGNVLANQELFQWVSARRHESLYLAGKTGLCKTRILQYWAKKAVMSGLKVIYWNTKDLLDMLCSTENAKVIDRLLNPLYRCDLLILDELGKENATPAKVKHLYGIIEKRYTGWDQKKHGRIDRYYGGQLWITTNVDANGLERIFGEDFPPVLRRLREMCEIWEGF